MRLTFLNDFRKDENGGILAFYIIMFMVMMIGGGMSIDFIRHEIKREALQSALDRGVLAATGNAQRANPITQDDLALAEQIAIETVRSYVQVAGFDPDAHGVVVTPDFSVNAKRVDVASNFSVDTYFLRLTGIDVLDGKAASAATLAANQIELSLIVDISGSMQGAKIDKLKQAATNFANLMLAGDRADFTSLSLVPFSGQVAATENMLKNYNYNRWHTFSNCVDFVDAADFSTTYIDPATPLEQTKHWRAYWMAPHSYFCPTPSQEILPLSNSLVDINTAINGLVASGETASHIGLKWGLTLLDPNSQFMVSDLVNRGDVSPLFVGRPASYGDQNTLKFVILMTDGDNTNQWDIINNPDGRYQYQGYEVLLDTSKDPGEAPNYLATLDELILNGHWYEKREPASGQRSAMLWDESWPPTPNRPSYEMPWDTYHVYSTVSPAEADTRLQSLCNLAKQQGIVIFSIAYDVAVDSNAYNQMNQCASPGNFYNVSTGGAGVNELDGAFNSIYQTIQKLKLTF